MFEKRKLKQFKNKLTYMNYKKEIENNYINATESIKSDQEICELIFKKDKSLLNILPIDYQISKINTKNYELIQFFSLEAKNQFLKNNFDNKEILSIYVSDYPSIIEECIKNNVNLLNDIYDSHILNNMLRILNNNNLLPSIIVNPALSSNYKLMKAMISINKQLLINVPKEIRMEYFYENIIDIENTFKYLTEQEKKEVFLSMVKKGIPSRSDFPFAISSIDIDTQMEIARIDLKYLKECNNLVQFNFFKKDSKLLGFLSNEVKQLIIKSNPELLDTIYCQEMGKIINIENYLNNINPNEIDINSMISSTYFGAKGTLLNIETRQGIYNMREGINQYLQEQIAFSHKLSNKQLSDLCSQDVNYILPIAAVSNPQEMIMAKNKIKNVFKNLYGEELLNKYSFLIDKVLDNYKFDSSTNSECILDSLKIIFNKNIIYKNDISLINRYIDNSINNYKNNELFRKIMLNSYGQNAEFILNSRPQLNEHNINSLEVFNSKIFENFEIGLIHDLLSYNIPNMTYFLSIVKDKNKLQILSELYKLESNIFGKNITTFQRTLNDFDNMESLLVNIGDKDLSSEEIRKLYNVIINHNYGNISSKEEIIDYEQNCKNKLIREIGKIKDINYIKEKILNALFGIHYNSFFNSELNFESGVVLSEFYNLANVHSSQALSNNQKNMMDFLNIVVNESDSKALSILINELFKEKDILGSYDFLSAINVLKGQQENLLNESLISVEKLEKEIEKSNGLVVKTNRHGVPIYILNGIEFGTLTHIISGTNNEFINEKSISLKDMETFEEQYGSSTISAWYNSNECFEENKISFSTSSSCVIGYASVPKGLIVGMDSGDISTDHASKLVTATSKGNTNFNRMHSAKKRSEVSFYRKYRNQDIITNENHGGRFDFDYFLGYISVDDISKTDEIDLNLSGDDFDLYGEAKKREKPIILINLNAYKNNVVAIEDKEGEKTL